MSRVGNFVSGSSPATLSCDPASESIQVCVDRGGQVATLARAALIAVISGAAGLGWAQEPAVPNPPQPAATQPAPAASGLPQAADGAVSATPASAPTSATASTGTSAT